VTTSTGLPEDTRVALERYVHEPGSLSDPGPLWTALHQHGPVHRLDEGQWLVIGFDAARQVLRDDSFGREAEARDHAARLAAAGGAVDTTAIQRTYLRWFLNMDGEAHGRLRRITGPVFRPRTLAALTPMIESVADAAIADLLTEPGAAKDLLGFAYEVPHQVVCQVLGVPTEDHTMWRESVELLADANQILSADDERARVVAAIERFEPYCRDLFEQQAGAQGEANLLAVLRAAADEDPTIDDVELIATLMLLIVAGHVTTVNMIANTSLLLASHPDQLAAVRADPSLVANAIEEAIRLEPPARVNVRRADLPIEVAGMTIPAGDTVLVVVGGANRDPARFPDPNTFDVTRADTQNLSFGFGTHFCVGAPLARLEGRIAIERLIDTCDVEVLAYRWSKRSTRALDNLQVLVSPHDGARTVLAPPSREGPS